MRTLLMLEDYPARFVCREFFEAQGCQVELAEDLPQAGRLLRFRRYDLLIADLARGADGRSELLRLIEDASQRNPSMVPVLLTTGEEGLAENPTLRVLIKPQSLHAILQLARGGAKRRGRL
jgi:DNA-binding NtrC family response regulator